MSDIADTLLTTHQAARRLGVSDRTVANWCGSGKLPGAYKVRRRARAGWAWRIPEAALCSVMRRGGISERPAKPRRGLGCPLPRPRQAVDTIAALFCANHCPDGGAIPLDCDLACGWPQTVDGSMCEDGAVCPCAQLPTGERAEAWCAWIREEVQA